MGVVFQAEHIRLGQSVAIKMLRPHARQPEFVARFAREARAAGQLRSAHAVRVMDVAETDSGLPYMVMELLEGRDLARELENRGRLPPQEAVDYVLEASEAMIEAHSLGIIHRDLKPSNLFVAIEGERRVIKVCDFGISKMETAVDMLVTATQSSIGTPLYMSPEQVRCSKRVDERTDVWSLGVILYELIAGSAPFAGGSAASLGAAIVTDPPLPFDRSLGVPEALERAIAVALSKNPDGRYPSMRAFGNALVPFASPGHIIPSSGSLLPPLTTLSTPASFPSLSLAPPGLGHAATVAAVPEARGALRRALLAAALVVPLGLGAIALVVARSHPPTAAPVATSPDPATPVSLTANLTQPDAQAANAPATPPLPVVTASPLPVSATKRGGALPPASPGRPVPRLPAASATPRTPSPPPAAAIPNRL